jgi:predicted ester cyclase
MPASQPQSTADRNKANVIKFFLGVFNDGNMSLVDELIAPNYTFDGQPNSRDQVKAWATGLRTQFPDLHFTIQQILAEGDLVALRWQMTGTNTGGPNPTGCSVTNTGTNIIRMDANGMGVENIQNGTCTVSGQITFTDSKIYAL